MGSQKKKLKVWKKDVAEGRLLFISKYIFYLNMKISFFCGVANEHQLCGLKSIYSSLVVFPIHVMYVNVSIDA